ncbi:MAG: type II secretion system minor pseudopilin GspH [Marinicellaceae bacterium]
MILKKQLSGFTLIEILVVVVIVSILSVLGVQMIASGSVERTLQQQGRMLQASIEYSCDQATLQNIPYGIKFYQSGYVFSQFVNQEWLDVQENEVLFPKEISEGLLLALRIDGASVILPEEEAEIPQILCDSSGKISPFELVISDVTEKHLYLLETIDLWQIDGRWLDEKEA